MPVNALSLKRLVPYLDEFAEACLREGFDTALISAVCLRETEAGWAPGYSPKGTHLGRGDSGHGFGLFQIDDRGPYRHLPMDTPDASPYLQARWCCWILEDAQRDLNDFRDNPFFERAIICNYNASLRRVREALILGHDPDTVTTKGPSKKPDYGSDVLRRRDELRKLFPIRFPPYRNGLVMV